MAVDKKITALTADTAPDGADLLTTVDDPGGTPVNKKATCANVITKAHGLSDGALAIDSGAITSAGEGTVGQVFTSNGAGVAPTFQAAAGGSLDDAYNAGSTITVDAGPVQLGVAAANVGLLLDAATIDHTQTAGVIDLNVDAAADGVLGINVTARSTGDFTNVSAGKFSATSGGMLTAFDTTNVLFVEIGDHASDAANTFTIGTYTQAKGMSAGAGTWYGSLIMADNSIFASSDSLDNTGNKFGIAVFLNDVAGTNNTTGISIQAKNTIVAAAELKGAQIDVEPRIAGITQIAGVAIGNVGDQTGTQVVEASGTWTTGLDLSSATLTTDIELSSGVINNTSGNVSLTTTTTGAINLNSLAGTGTMNLDFEVMFMNLNDGGTISIDAATNLATGEVVVLDINTDADNVRGFVSNLRQTATDSFGSAFYTKTSSLGMNTSGDNITGYRAALAQSASDAAGTTIYGLYTDVVTASASSGDLVGTFIDFETTPPANTGSITGASIAISNASASAIKGLVLNNSGATTGDTAVDIDGTWTDGVDLSGATTTTDIELSSGVINNTSADITIQNTTSGNVHLKPVTSVTAGDGGSTNYVEVDATGDVLFHGGAGLAYGGIYAYDANDTITIGSSGKANKVQITTFDTNGASNNTTPDHTNDHITITEPGDYLVTVSLSAESAGGSAYEIGASVWVNNGATEKQALHVHRELSGAGGDTGSLSMSGIATCADNDTLEVWVWNETNTNNIVIDDISLAVVQIGG